MVRKIRILDEERRNRTPPAKKLVTSLLQGEHAVIPAFYRMIAEETFVSKGDSLVELLMSYPDDLIRIYAYPHYRGYSQIDEQHSNGFSLLEEENTWVDEWRVTWHHKADSVGSISIGHPLRSYADFAGYVFPRGCLPTRLANASTQIERIRDRNDKYIVGHVGFGIFELGQSLRGMENFLADFYTDKNMALRLIRELANFHLSLIEEWARLDVAAVHISDDWGGQDALLVSPQLFRECFKPYYRELFACAHRNGMQVFFHSCGAVQQIIGDLLEVGVDVLHPLQPGANDYHMIARTYGRDLTVQGGLDVQHTLTRGGPDQIERSLYEFVEIFRKYDCGVILSPTNTIVPESPIENIEFAFQTMRRISEASKKAVA